MMNTISNKNQHIHKKISEPTPYSTYNGTMNKQTQTQQKQITEPVAILVDKIYAYCQQRDCFPSFKIDIPEIEKEYRFTDITFQEGYISEGTLTITPIGHRRPNFSRVKFLLKIPYTIKFKNIISGKNTSINGTLPDIVKDIVLFMPETKNEFDFRIVVETRSETLSPVEIVGEKVEMPVGVLSVIRVVGRIQLLIPGYRVPMEPPEAENFEETEKSIVQEFDNRPFPDDFFPPEFKDLEMSVKSPIK